MTSRAEIIQAVRRRAGDRCEYCRMHQALQGGTFHLEHIVPESLGGLLQPDNLAWSCPGCNLRKSDRVLALDPDSGVIVALFNPRKDSWVEHFRWDGYQIAGLTPIGRATVLALELNHPRRLLIRHAEEMFQLFPP
jgi:hypothetical protein